MTNRNTKSLYIFCKALVFSVFFGFNQFFLPPLSVKAQGESCNDILYAPLYNREILIETDTEDDYFRSAMCSMTEEEFRNYRHKDNYEYEKYCSLDEGEARQVFKTAFKGGFGPWSADGKFDAELFNKWKREQCSETAKRNILTTDDFRKYKKNYCSDLTRKSYRDAFRYHFQRLTNIDARIQAWSICMKTTPSSDVQTTSLRCWLSPEDAEELVKLNIYWWRLGKADAKVVRWILIGGEVVPGGEFPGFVANDTTPLKERSTTLTRGTTSFLIKRDKDEDLRALLNIEVEDFRFDCDVLLPKIKPEKQEPEKQEPEKQDPMALLKERCESAGRMWNESKLECREKPPVGLDAKIQACEAKGGEWFWWVHQEKKDGHCDETGFCHECPMPLTDHCFRHLCED